MTTIARATAWFSPRGGSTAAWVEHIAATQRRFRVAAYAFTSFEIATALLEAFDRGVKVEGIFCPTMAWSRESKVGLLHDAGIPCWIDAKHKIFHNKYGIRDNAAVLEGSFNLTASAEKSNAENLVVLESQDLAIVYLANWEIHKAHAIAFTPKPPRALAGIAELTLGQAFGDEDEPETEDTP